MDRRFLILAVAACLALADSAAAKGKQFAVCVGIEQYASDKLPRLKYTVEDAHELAEVLELGGYQVKLLSDVTGDKDPALAPSKPNIEREITDAAKQCGEGDILVIAFAGHGLQFKGQPDAYFCPREAKPFPDETATLISVTKIYEQLEKSIAGVKVMLVDACRNDPGPLARGVDADSAPIPPRGVAAYFSCSAGEQALEFKSLEHGVFFFHVLEALKGAAKNERDEVGLLRLMEYVSPAVINTVRDFAPEHQQVPDQNARFAGVSPVLLRITPALEDRFPREGSSATNSLGLKLIFCPAGTFNLGSRDDDLQADDDEQPAKSVRIGQSFWLAKYETTQQEWKRVMDTEPWRGKPNVLEGPDAPCVFVSYRDAVRFCERLTKLERDAGKLKASEAYRLPTDAQWEYACRAGTTTRFSFGDNERGLEDYAWFDGAHNSAQRVGRKKPNPWNLHDLHGNVWELCDDAFPGKPKLRILRGGSWDYSAGKCRSAERNATDENSTANNQGFRVAKVGPIRE